MPHWYPIAIVSLSFGILGLFFLMTTVTGIGRLLRGGVEGNAAVLLAPLGSLGMAVLVAGLLKAGWMMGSAQRRTVRRFLSRELDAEPVRTQDARQE